jgi:hypothetical protein
MSTRVGTLQAPKAGGSILLAAFLASFVILTIAVVALSSDRDQGRQGETTFVGRQVVNTPSDLIAGAAGQTFVGGTAANTPSELNAQARLELGVKAHEKFMRDTLGTNTPTELSGGVIGGLPAKLYDRHQRR